MRPPQSTRQNLPLRSFPVVIFTVLVAILSVGARAATQQLACSPAALHFGTVPVGQTETQLVVLTNSGPAAVTVSAMSLSATEFSVSPLSLPVTLSAGQSVAVTVTFSPTATGWTGGKVTFTSTASNPVLQLQLGGIGVNSDGVTASPANLSFGQVALGSSSTQSVVLTNNRTWNITLSSFQTTGSGFSVSGLTLPLTLSPRQSVAFNVTFTPQTAGAAGGSVFLMGPALNVPFSGTGGGVGAGQLTLTPPALSFGSVAVGQTGTQTAALNATGGSVTISSISSGNAQFSVPGISLPLTINAGGSVQFNVAFTPSNVGSVSSALSFTSNATNTAVSESLTGAGTAPSVVLSWNASTSQVAGYNIYRRLAPNGAYSKLNSTLDAVTEFTDTAVTLGQTYDYATTAVTSSGEESPYSNQVEVVIP